MDSTFDNTFDTSTTLTEAENTIVFTAAETGILEMVMRELRKKADELGVVASEDPQNENGQVAHMKAESAYDLVNSVYDKVIHHRDMQGQPHHNPTSP